MELEYDVLLPVVPDVAGEAWCSVTCTIDAL